MTREVKKEKSQAQAKLQICSTALPVSQMCPHETGDTPPDGVQDMVAVEGKQNTLNGSHCPSGTTHSNGVNGHSSSSQRRNPYAPRASDFLNNVSNFKIIESTLRGFCLYRSHHSSYTADMSFHRGGAVCQCLLRH